jgi:hypothetical protein
LNFGGAENQVWRGSNSDLVQEGGHFLGIDGLTEMEALCQMTTHGSQFL